MDRKVRTGRVVSAKMDKTVVVAVDRKRTNRLYKKAVTATTKFKVHDEKGISSEGDTVRIQETRPLIPTLILRRRPRGHHADHPGSETRVPFRHAFANLHFVLPIIIAER